MGFFWGKFLVQGFFWVLLEALGIFLGIDFAPIRSSPSLETRSTPPGPVVKSEIKFTKKFFPVKHKKSAIHEIKLLQKFYTTGYIQQARVEYQLLFLFKSQLW